MARGKGEGSIYKQKDGAYQASIETGYVNGKRRRKYVNGRTITECRRNLERLKRELSDGLLDDGSRLSEWIEYYLEMICKPRIAVGTYEGYYSKMHLYVIPVIGDIRLRNLTPDHIRMVHEAMRNMEPSRKTRRTNSVGMSASTIRQTHVVLSKCLKTAEREKKIRVNPCSLMDSPATEKRPMDTLSVDQAQQVLKCAADNRTLARLTCALVLGVRQGEALALKWDDLDLESGTLRIDEAATWPVGGKAFLKVPKTKASIRTMPLPPDVASIFREWKEESGMKDEFIFPGFSGGLERHERDRAVWDVSLERAGVPNIPLHGARGTAASLLQKMGIPERIIADILGHANARVTQDHYLHSDAEQRSDALGALAKGFKLSASDDDESTAVAGSGNVSSKSNGRASTPDGFEDAVERAVARAMEKLMKQ